MSSEWSWVKTAKTDCEEPWPAHGTHTFDLTRSLPGRTDNPVGLIALLFVMVALGLLACSPEETSTGPSGGAGSELAVAKAYTAVDLGTLDIPQGLPAFSVAYDINDAGQVVGVSSSPQIIQGSRPGPAGQSLASHAFRWEKGVMTDLGTLGGYYSFASGINPAGEVVGTSFILPPSPGNAQHAFLWTNGVMTDLGTLGGPESAATKINPRGQVVGHSQIAEGISGPSVFLWEKGVMTNLGFAGAIIAAEGTADINPAGRVVSGGFLWDKGVLTNLGTLGGCCTTANAINPAGQVVGKSYLPGNEVYHAFLWDKGVMTDLGTLGGNSEARGINSRGQVVGGSGNRAFVWEKGVMTELASDRRFASQAEAINAAGQIVGSSGTEQGARATLWTRR
jgi:probable HAF family extracellular repeat protein